MLVHRILCIGIIMLTPMVIEGVRGVQKAANEAKTQRTMSTHKDLEQFAVACAGTEGVYHVFYAALEPATLEAETLMCEE